MIKICFVLLVSITGSSLSAATISHWKLDEVKGGGIIRDVVGDNNGEIKGCDNLSSFIVATEEGKAAHFSGTKERVVVKHDASLSLINDFMIECEVRPEAIEKYRTIIWKGDRSKRPEQINYFLNIRKGRLEFKFKDEGGKWYVYASPEKSLHINKWVTIKLIYEDGVVAMVFDGEAQKVKSPFRADDIKIAALFPNIGSLYIGCGATANESQGYPFKGMIKNIKITTLK